MFVPRIHIVCQMLLWYSAVAAEQPAGHAGLVQTREHPALRIRSVAVGSEPILSSSTAGPLLRKRGDGKKKQHKKKKKKGTREASAQGEETQRSSEQGTSRLSDAERQRSADSGEAQSTRSQQRGAGHHPWEPEGDNEWVPTVPFARPASCRSPWLDASTPTPAGASLTTIDFITSSTCSAPSTAARPGPCTASSTPSARRGGWGATASRTS